MRQQQYPPAAKLIKSTSRHNLSKQLQHTEHPIVMYTVLSGAAIHMQPPSFISAPLVSTVRTPRTRQAHAMATDMHESDRRHSLLLWQKHSYARIYWKKHCRMCNDTGKSTVQHSTAAAVNTSSQLKPASSTRRLVPQAATRYSAHKSDDRSTQSFIESLNKTTAHASMSRLLSLLTLHCTSNPACSSRF